MPQSQQFQIFGEVDALSPYQLQVAGIPAVDSIEIPPDLLRQAAESRQFPEVVREIAMAIGERLVPPLLSDSPVVDARVNSCLQVASIAVRSGLEEQAYLDEVARFAQPMAISNAVGRQMTPKTERAPYFVR